LGWSEINRPQHGPLLFLTAESQETPSTKSDDRVARRATPFKRTMVAGSEDAGALTLTVRGLPSRVPTSFFVEEGIKNQLKVVPSLCEEQTDSKNKNQILTTKPTSKNLNKIKLNKIEIYKDNKKHKSLKKNPKKSVSPKNPTKKNLSLSKNQEDSKNPKSENKKSLSACSDCEKSNKVVSVSACLDLSRSEKIESKNLNAWVYSFNGVPWSELSLRLGGTQQ
jgi:hypothetical protein